MIYYVVGDAARLIRHGRDDRVFIAHVVNDAGKYGAGFTKSLYDMYGTSWGKAYRSAIETGELELGSIQIWNSPSGVTVANLCAQQGVFSYPHNTKPFRLHWFEACLDRLCEHLATLPRSRNQIIQSPRLGSGLGRGSWPMIERAIWDHVAHYYDWYVVDLPGESRH